MSKVSWPRSRQCCVAPLCSFRTNELPPMSNKLKIDPRVRSNLDELRVDVVRSKGGTFFVAVAAVVIGIAGVVLILVYIGILNVSRRQPNAAIEN